MLFKPTKFWGTLLGSDRRLEQGLKESDGHPPERVAGYIPMNSISRATMLTTLHQTDRVSAFWEQRVHQHPCYENDPIHTRDQMEPPSP